MEFNSREEFRGRVADQLDVLNPFDFCLGRVGSSALVGFNSTESSTNAIFVNLVQVIFFFNFLFSLFTMIRPDAGKSMFCSILHFCRLDSLLIGL